MIDCVIFAGADMNISCVDKNNFENAFIICADRGVEHAIKLDLKPDLIVGDFDSLGYVPDADCEIMTFRPEKDDTDLMIAVKQAVCKGKKNIRIYAALGGRLDHTIGNIQTLSFALDNGCRAELVSENEIVTLLAPGKNFIQKKKGFSLSLFSYGDNVTGLCISGTKYTLNNGEINNSFPIGVSNEIIDDVAKITFESGKLLVVCSSVTT